MRFLKTLWAFSRPHTIIGSFVSILSIYAICIAYAYPSTPAMHLQDYWIALTTTLLSALCCNIYITGLNQIEDYSLDKINKPWLPLPAGTLSLKKAKVIVAIAGFLAVLFALSTNLILLALIIIIMLVGSAYSMPPLQFKRDHISAAASILMVRGLLVNVGMPVQFMYTFGDGVQIPADIWPLTFFNVGFSLAIAWFKDIPDTGGDKVFNIKTLALRFSPLAAFRYGVAVVAVSYIGLLFLSVIIGIHVHQKFFYVVHAFLFLAFLLGASSVKLGNTGKLKRSYLVFWVFFFAEYIVYAWAYYL